MKQIAIHPILLAIYPVLSLYVFNTDEVLIQEALAPLVIVLPAALLVWFIISRLVAGRAKAAILTSVLLILFFSFGHAIYAFRTFLNSLGLWNITDLLSESTGGLLLWNSVWVFLFVMTAFLIRKTSSDLQSASQFLNVFSLALVLILIVNWAIWHSNESAPFAYSEAWNKAMRSLGSSTPPSQSSSSRPSIYYIILDGYAREDILKSIYGMDNAQFYSFLTEKGFYIARQSTSNYVQTPLSIASSLNFTYLDNLAKKIGEQATSRQPLTTMISNSELLARLHANGYKLVAFSTGYSLTEIRGADVYKSPGIVLSAFDNLLLDTTPVQLLPRLPFLTNQYDLHRARILYTLNELPAVDRSGGPTFVFAHIIAPHPPFVFDANGAPVNPQEPFGLLDDNRYMPLAEEQEYVEAYRQQLAFVSTRIRQVIRELLSRPDPPIIIVQGDHGPRPRANWASIDKTDLVQQMSILNAYYFPDRDYRGLYPTITPVNSFTIVLNHYFDANLAMSEDRNYFSFLDRPYLFTDVTDKVRAQH